MENINIEESIKKYKEVLTKLWKQSSENTKIDIKHSEDIDFIKDNIVKFNIQDNYIRNLLITTFDGIQFWDKYTFVDSSHYFEINGKILSISGLQIDIKCNIEQKRKVKEKSLFLNKESEKIKKTVFSLYNDYAAKYINKYFEEKSNNIILCNYIALFHNVGFLNLKIIIPLLSFNNIFIPITKDEFNELKNYELECRKRDDLEDIYRNLTLLTPTEYKEFLMYKESQKVYSKDKEIIK